MAASVSVLDYHGQQRARAACHGRRRSPHCPRSAWVPGPGQMDGPTGIVLMQRRALDLHSPTEFEQASHDPAVPPPAFRLHRFRCFGRLLRRVAAEISRVERAGPPGPCPRWLRRVLCRRGRAARCSRPLSACCVQRSRPRDRIHGTANNSGVGWCGPARSRAWRRAASMQARGRPRTPCEYVRFPGRQTVRACRRLRGAAARQEARGAMQGRAGRLVADRHDRGGGVTCSQATSGCATCVNSRHRRARKPAYMAGSTALTSAAPARWCTSVPQRQSRRCA